MALSERDEKVMAFYAEGKELSGFEGVHENLCNMGFLDDDLELTSKGHEYLNDKKKFNQKKQTVNWDGFDIIQSVSYDQDEDFLSITHSGESFNMTRENWNKLVSLVASVVPSSRIDL